MDYKLILIVSVAFIFSPADSSSSSSSQSGETFNYTIMNILVEPYFTESIELDINDEKPLIYYMEKTVKIARSRFGTFTATYFGFGYLIDAINGVRGFESDQTWWAIWNSDGLIPVGVSDYIVQPGEQILFYFTQGWP